MNLKLFVKRLYFTYIVKDLSQLARSMGVKVGKGCIFQDSPTHIFTGEPFLVELGNNVRVTYGVQFITHDGGLIVLRNMYKEKMLSGGGIPLADYSTIDLFGRIKVGNNVHIGINSIIMPGVTIGSNVVIGCGAVVSRDIPDNCVAVGVPARPIETIYEYFEKHINDYDFTKNLSKKEKRDYLTQKYFGNQ